MIHPTFEQEEFLQKLKSAFQEKTDKYRTTLSFQTKSVLMMAKSVIWDIQKEINQKLIELQEQIEHRINDLAVQSQEQLELIEHVEQIIEQKRLISEVPPDQLQQVADIMEEGVDVNLKRWDNWKEQNVNLFLEEILKSKGLYKPFIQYQLGNYIGADEETGQVKLLFKKEDEEKSFAGDDSLLNKFKNMINGVVRQASSFSSRGRRGSSSLMSSNNEFIVEPQDHVHTLHGHQQQVYSCIQLSDDSYVTSSFDGTMKVWNRDDYRLEFSSPHLQTPYNDIVEITNHKLDENTLLFAAANDDGTIKIFIKLPNNPWGFYKELPKVREGTPFHLVYDDKLNVLIYNTQRNGRIMQIYDMTTFKISQLYPHKFTQSSSGTCLALLPTEQRFISGDIQGYMYKWAYTSKQPLVKYQAHENCLNSMVVLKDFRVATCCQDGLLKLWSGSLLGNKPLQVFEHKVPLWSLCATKTHIISGDVEGFITYHSLDTLSIKKSTKGHTSGIFMIKECEAECTFSTSSEDFKAKIWSL